MPLHPILSASHLSTESHSVSSVLPILQHSFGAQDGRFSQKLCAHNASDLDNLMTTLRVGPCENFAMSESTEHLNVVRRYLKSIEDGAFSEVESLFTADAVMEQLPNRLYPNGLNATLSQMKSAFEKGRKLLAKQTYSMKHALAEGNSVSAEVLWTGTLAVGFGNLAAGAQMRCHSAMFFTFKAGKIATQRNYDCFEPW